MTGPGMATSKAESSKPTCLVSRRNMKPPPDTRCEWGTAGEDLSSGEPAEVGREESQRVTILYAGKSGLSTALKTCLGLKGDKGDTPIARDDPTEVREGRTINARAHDILIAHFSIVPSLPDSEGELTYLARVGQAFFCSR